MNGSSEVDPVAYFIFVLDLRYTNTVPVTRTQQLSAALSTWFLVTTLTEYADILYRISNVRIGQLLRCLRSDPRPTLTGTGVNQHRLTSPQNVLTQMVHAGSVAIEYLSFSMY